MHSHGLYFSSTILVAWTSCIKFTLVTRPPPINYGPRSTHASRPNDRTKSNQTWKPFEPSESDPVIVRTVRIRKPKMSKNIRYGVHPRKSETYTCAYVQNIHAIHTHILAQVTLNILCSTHSSIK